MFICCSEGLGWAGKKTIAEKVKGRKICSNCEVKHMIKIKQLLGYHCLISQTNFKTVYVRYAALSASLLSKLLIEPKELDFFCVDLLCDI